MSTHKKRKVGIIIEVALEIIAVAIGLEFLSVKKGVVHHYLLYLPGAKNAFIR